MATPFQEIVNAAQFRVTDYDMLKQSFQMHVDVMHRFLMSAIADFAPYCQVDLTDRDEPLAQFNQDLDDECIEILALGVSAYWLSSKILNDDLLRNRLSTKEYSYFSPANLMREVQTLRSEVMGEFRAAIVNYTYRHGDIVNPGKGA